jgi:hypothetical protein
MPRAARSAKRRKTRVEGGDAAARGGHDEGESGDGANLLCALPLALQEHIASLLDHDSLFTSARVCKAWRDVVSSASPTPMRGVLKRIVEGNAQLLKLIDRINFNDRAPPELAGRPIPAFTRIFKIDATRACGSWKCTPKRPGGIVMIQNGQKKNGW